MIIVLSTYIIIPPNPIIHYARLQLMNQMHLANIKSLIYNFEYSYLSFYYI